MTLFVICAVGVALLCAVAVLFLVRFARRRSDPGAPVPHYIVPYTPVRAPARTPAPAPSAPAPPPPSAATQQRPPAPPDWPPAPPAAPIVSVAPATPPPTPPAAPVPAAPPSWEDEPYGTGSAHPLPDGSAPSAEYTVKGDPDEMRYFTMESQDFGRVRAEVWFRTERDAQKAGFTRSQA